jgi:hypothetical protein
MENPASANDYEEAKSKAKELYSKIGRIWCPVLKDYVAFTSIGLRHLIRKRGIRRPKSEQKRRFVLLHCIVPIITDPRAKVLHEEKETLRLVNHSGNKMAIPAQAEFWKFVAVQNGRIVRIVIRQFKNGKKHFLSVYGKEQKSAL